MDEVHRVYNKVSNFPNFFDFRQNSPNFGPFPKIRNTIDSGMKGVDTGSVSKRYQTSLFAQFSKTLLEVIFDLNRSIFNIQKPPSEITRYGVHFQSKMF